MLAQEEARRLDHNFIGTEHILLGLIAESEGIAGLALGALGVTLDAARAMVRETIPTAASAPTASPPFTPRAKKVLELALREALQLGHSYIGTEHLLLGLLREGEGSAVQVLVSLGVDLRQARQEVLQRMTGYQVRAVGDVGGGSTPPGSAPSHPQGLPVGRRWTAEVVVAGRGPEDFADAYDQLVELARTLGLEDLDSSRVHTSSVETPGGPGLRLSVVHDLTGGAGDDHEQPETPDLGGRPASSHDNENDENDENDETPGAKEEAGGGETG